MYKDGEWLDMISGTSVCLPERIVVLNIQFCMWATHHPGSVYITVKIIKINTWFSTDNEECDPLFDYWHKSTQNCRYSSSIYGIIFFKSAIFFACIFGAFLMRGSSVGMWLTKLIHFLDTGTFLHSSRSPYVVFRYTQFCNNDAYVSRIAVALLMCNATVFSNRGARLLKS